LEPPRARKAAAQPPLLRALRACSLPLVQSALKEDPEAANGIFWDHRCDPPLCVAVRLRCGADIVKLLLEHGADPVLTDRQGKTPLRLLAERSHRPELLQMTDMPQLPFLRTKSFIAARDPSLAKDAEEDILAVAKMLVRYGADPLCLDSSGKSAADVALSEGSNRLAAYLQRLQASRLMAELSLANMSGSGDLAIFPECLVSRFVSFLF